MNANQQCDRNAWPGMVLSFYQKKATRQAVLAAAAIPNREAQAEQLCEAHFFPGEYDLRRRFIDKFDLLHLARRRAIAEFQAAAKVCPVNLFPYRAARAELKRFGPQIEPIAR